MGKDRGVRGLTPYDVLIALGVNQAGNSLDYPHSKD